MAKAILSKRKSDAIANGAFLISLGVLFFTNAWWPGILLALWVTLALRQYLTGRHLDLVITSLLLLGLFVVSMFNMDLKMMLSLFFVVGGVYIIWREYSFTSDDSQQKEAQHIKKASDQKQAKEEQAKQEQPKQTQQEQASQEQEQQKP